MLAAPIAVDFDLLVAGILDMAHSESPTAVDEKDFKTDLGPAAPELEHGHLQELEVDVDKVAHDERQHSIEEDTSPYPEGMKSPVIDSDIKC